MHEQGQIEEANKVLWRANKAIADKDAFSQLYSEMLEGKWTEPTSRVMPLDLDSEMNFQEEEEEEVS